MSYLVAFDFVVRPDPVPFLLLDRPPFFALDVPLDRVLFLLFDPELFLDVDPLLFRVADPVPFLPVVEPVPFLPFVVEPDAVLLPVLPLLPELFADDFLPVLPALEPDELFFVLPPAVLFAPPAPFSTEAVAPSTAPFIALSMTAPATSFAVSYIFANFPFLAAIDFLPQITQNPRRSNGSKMRKCCMYD